MDDKSNLQENIKLAEGFMAFNLQRAGIITDKNMTHKRENPVEKYDGAIWAIKDYDTFLKNGVRRYVYLTSVGQAYHKAQNFQAQFTVLTDIIKAQLRQDRKVKPLFSKILGPFEIVILVGDSLQSYSLVENSYSDLELFDIKTQNQCATIKKRDSEKKLYIEHGDYWIKSITPIYQKLLDEIRAEFGEEVIDFKIVRWSKDIDPYFEGEQEKMEIGNRCINLMNRVEKNLKKGLKHCKDYSKYEQHLQYNLLSVKYQIEEAIVLKWLLPSILLSKNHQSNSLIAECYPADVPYFKLLFNAVERSLKELNIEEQLTQIAPLVFEDKSSTNAFRKQIEKNKSTWSYPFVGWSDHLFEWSNEEESERIQHKISEQNKDKSCEVYSQKVREKYTEYLEQQNNNLVKEATEYSLAFISTSAEKSQHNDDAQKHYDVQKLLGYLHDIFSINEYYFSGVFIPWDITNAKMSIISALNMYIKFGSKITRNNQQEAKNIKSLLIDKQNPSYKELTWLLINRCNMVMGAKGKEFNLKGEFFKTIQGCIYQLIRHHGVIIRKSGSQYFIEVKGDRPMEMTADEHILNEVRKIATKDPTAECNYKIKLCVELLESVRYIFHDRKKMGCCLFSRVTPKIFDECIAIIKKYNELFIFPSPGSQDQIDFSEVRHNFGGFSFQGVFSLRNELRVATHQIDSEYAYIRMLLNKNNSPPAEAIANDAMANPIMAEFKSNPDDAYDKLIENISEIKHLLEPLVVEALCTNLEFIERFITYENAAAKYFYEYYNNEISKYSPSLIEAKVHIQQLASNTQIVFDYIRYIREKRSVESPILLALEHIQKHTNNVANDNNLI